MHRTRLSVALAVYMAVSVQTAMGDGLDCQVDRAGSLRGGATPRVRLSAVSEDDDIVAELRITNGGRKPYRLWRYKWPAGGRLVGGGLFTVYREKLELRFEGMNVNLAVSEEDYVSVPPGSTCTATLSLGVYYDVRPKGTYSIQFGVTNRQWGHRRGDRLESNVVTVERK